MEEISKINKDSDPYVEDIYVTDINEVNGIYISDLQSFHVDYFDMMITTNNDFSSEYPTKYEELFTVTAFSFIEEYPIIAEYYDPSLFQIESSTVSLNDYDVDLKVEREVVGSNVEFTFFVDTEMYYDWEFQQVKIGESEEFNSSKAIYLPFYDTEEYNMSFDFVIQFNDLPQFGGETVFEYTFHIEQVIENEKTLFGEDGKYTMEIYKNG